MSPIYKRTHRALARAIQKVGHGTDMSDEQVLALAEAIADVCEENTPTSATFDREVFIALATQRQMSIPG